MKSQFVDSKVIKARIFGLYIGAEFEYQLKSQLDFFLSASAVLETGSSEVIGTFSPYEPTETLNLESGGMVYKPWSFYKAYIGALGQGSYHAPLLLADTPFAGLKQVIEFGSFTLSAQQAIPSNNHLSKRTGSIETGTPLFQIETLSYAGGEEHTLKIDFSHFAFKDLSSGVAENSQLFGNTISGVGAGSIFIYEFEGYNMVAASTLSIGPVKLQLGGQSLYNDKAAEGHNRGSLAYVGVQGDSLGMRLESFRNESNASVAFYNSKDYGNNNMEGQAVVLNIIDKDLLSHIRIARMELIESSAVQADTYTISMGLKKSFDY
jgi:hypothetical protein